MPVEGALARMALSATFYPHWPFLHIYMQVFLAGTTVHSRPNRDLGSMQPTTQFGLSTIS
jgi:hypothetical protein